MVSASDIYEKNKDSQELKAWISLYEFLINGDDKNRKLWLEFHKDSQARAILAAQRQFVKDFLNENYLKTNKVVVNKDLILFKTFKNFSIARGRGDKWVEVDFID